MITFTLAEIATVTGGYLHDVSNPQAQVDGISSSDSRTVGLGGLFIAVTGARVDGHDFVGQALSNGAVATLATRGVGSPAIVVDDVTAALGQLARHAINTRLADTHVIALTGSAGKTTTKDLLSQVLTHHGKTMATHGSFNTEVGLPLAVLRADEDARYLVLEMSARHQGDIAYLTTIAAPKVGIVLNIGSAHLGEFGSREGTAQAKGELVEALPSASNGGIAILNADDPLVSAMAARTTATLITFGTSTTATVYALDVSLPEGRAVFDLHTPSGSSPVTLQLLGAHQVHNALAVAATAHALGMDVVDIAQALSTAQPVSFARLQVHERQDGVTIVNDAFNANPESMRAGLETLAAIAAGRRSVAVLGAMGELGEITTTAHETIGSLLGELGIDVLVTVGDGPVLALADAARHSATPPTILTAHDPDTLRPLLTEILESGDVVLIKASRFVGLENFADTLMPAGA